MSTQSKGSARELQMANRLRDQGWVVKGHGDAHGATDLLCCRGGEIMLVQIKANKTGGAFMNFRPRERHEMLEEARAAGGRAVLVWWPADRKGARWCWSESWPNGPAAGCD